MAEFPVGIDAEAHLCEFELPMANRHGLITGATGTGKTVTLQVLAEQFSTAGVSVFAADVKGDLTGISQPAMMSDKLEKRIKGLKIKNYVPHGNPVVLWDLYGKNGHPLRTTISDMGPLLLGRILNLNDTQQGLLNAAFSFADDQQLLLLDIRDMRSLLDWMGQNANDLSGKYGNIASATVGAIQRGLLSLSEAGGDIFFGEPAFKIDTLFQKDPAGKGIINILDATQLVNDGRLYSTFLLWLLSDLFETLPEVGDLDKPKVAFFFDEAHLMFNTAPKPLLSKIEQMVRLIRSKGIGVYFISQSPMDVPDIVLGQLGNRVQHALRAFTPKDQKSVKVAAQTFRKNPKLDTETVITQLSVGEALISFLDTTGTPNIVQKYKIYPPASRIGPITEAEREALIKNSPYYGQYEKTVDRESAYEILSKRIADKQTETEEAAKEARSPGRPRETIAESMLKSTARSFGTQLGRQIVRGILGSIFGKK